jgi:hypothetical protein
MGKIRVIRGQARALQYEGTLQLIQDDRRFNHGFKIRRFMVSTEFPADSSAGSRDLVAVLATHHEAIQVGPGVSVGWAWDDRRQVAWAGLAMDGDSTVGAQFELIDPTHVVVRDLYVGISSLVATGNTYFNYYVELEEVSLTDNQAVLAIVQEEAQDVN